MVDIARDPVILMYSIQIMLGFGAWVFFCLALFAIKWKMENKR